MGTSAAEEAIERRPASTDPSNITTGANGDNPFDNLGKTINHALKDLSAIVVVTAKANTDTAITINTTSGEIEVPKIAAKLNAMTSIGLDGDYVDVTPDESVDAQRKAEIMQRHDRNVERAVDTWNNFVNGVVQLVRIAADLSDRPLPNSFSEAGRIVTIPSRSTS